MTAPALSRPQEFARKALHLAMATVPLAWARAVISPVQVRTGLVILAALAIAIEVARARVPALQRLIVRFAGPLMRAGEAREITGATWLAVGCALAVLAFPSRPAIAALWAVTAGDALAAVVGRAMTPSAADAVGTKTVAGSATVLVVTAIGAWGLARATPLVAVAVGGAAMLAERPRTAIDDNVRVALAAGVAAWVLGVA